MDGFRVMPMAEAAKIGDIFVTVTGNKSVLAHDSFERMKDGAVICNSGHFNVEIDIPALEKLSNGKKIARPFVEEYSTKDGRRIYLLGEGRLINLAAAEGHPAVVIARSPNSSSNPWASKWTSSRPSRSCTWPAGRKARKVFAAFR
jgi:adenosylhomocysteinase